MGSDSRSPKAHHRFGFSGPRTRKNTDGVTTDDILDSLTRQAELRQKHEKKDRLALAEITEAEDPGRFHGFNSEPESPSIVERKITYEHLLFVLMLLTGLVVAIWLYSSISKPFDLPQLNGIIQKSGVRSVFVNLVQLGIIALAAVVGALWIRRKRIGSTRQLLSL